MAIIDSGLVGTPLKDIIAGRDFDYIECRVKWTDEDGFERDEYWGACQSRAGELYSLDADTYSLNDRYVDWEVEGSRLTVWEQGEIIKET